MGNLLVLLVIQPDNMGKGIFDFRSLCSKKRENCTPK